jgi:hypothetical protein
LREHYLVDLIAAVPYTLAVQWVARRWVRYMPAWIAGRFYGRESQS